MKYKKKLISLRVKIDIYIPNIEIGIWGKKLKIFGKKNQRLFQYYHSGTLLIDPGFTFYVSAMLETKQDWLYTFTS